MIRLPQIFPEEQTKPMNHAKHYRISLFIVPLVLVLSTTFLFGQPPAQQLEPSYEVALQVVIGSNDAAMRGELPASLTAISRQIKSTFAFQNYRLANTFMGRVSNTGNVEYKSVSNIFGEPTEVSDAQTFLEWSLLNFQAMPAGFQARSFRFGARIPLVTRQMKDAPPMVNYESIGLTMNTIGLPINKPTLVGTLSLPKTSGTVFLIVTIKPAE